MLLIFPSAFFICAQALSALSDSLPPVKLKIIPPTNKPTPRVAAPKAAAPAAIPPPPVASVPPPSNAKVALVAATPLNDAIAVPVEAVPKAITAAVVAPAAAKPPAAPKPAPPSPPRRTPAPTDTSLIFSPSYFGSETPFLEYVSKVGLFLICSNKSENSLKLCRISSSNFPSLSIFFVVVSFSFSNLAMFLSWRLWAAFAVSFASFIFLAPCAATPTPVVPATTAAPFNAMGINQIGKGIIYSPISLFNISQHS